MFSFVIQLSKLLVAVLHGIKDDPEFRVLLLLMVTLLLGATIFYWRTEGWDIVDALYFSVMTMSTIGYGDIHPTTTLSKMFTIVFALLSIGIFAAVVSKLVAIILKRKKQNAESRNKSDASSINP